MLTFICFSILHYLDNKVGEKNLVSSHPGGDTFVQSTRSELCFLLLSVSERILKQPSHELQHSQAYKRSVRVFKSHSMPLWLVMKEKPNQYQIALKHSIPTKFNSPWSTNLFQIANTRFIMSLEVESSFKQMKKRHQVAHTLFVALLQLFQRCKKKKKSCMVVFFPTAWNVPKRPQITDKYSTSNNVLAVSLQGKKCTSQTTVISTCYKDIHHLFSYIKIQLI